MILLDTNVVSELMRQPSVRDKGVTAFMAATSLETLFLPSLVAAEIRYGIVRMPEGQKRVQYLVLFNQLLAQGFQNRILVFDDACAASYAQARAARERMGRPIAMADAMIGGMALAYGAILATRNVKDFDFYGLNLVNPWQP